MYTSYKFIKTSTAGNRTGFIIGSKAYRQRDKIMNIILKKKNLEAEQYAFLWKESEKSFPSFRRPTCQSFNVDRESKGCVLNMAGGELSGGAVLASPIILDNFKGKTTVTTVGNNLKTRVTCLGKNKIYVQTEIPGSMLLNRPALITINSLGGIEGYKVNLEGISYFVTREPISKKPSFKDFLKLDQELETQKVRCIGIIEIKKIGESKPIIWIKDVGTITQEQGCTTGTISAQLCYPVKNGWWKQPSGESIRAEIDDSIKIEACVERLSDGYLYLNDET